MTRWKPGVSKLWLYLLAGGVWSVIGIMLVRLGLSWLIPLEFMTAVLVAMGGFILGLPINRLGFSRFALKNINRLDALAGEKICVFAFQSWISYPMVVFMISLGVFLRKYSAVPKPLLAVVYIGIGFGLFLSSVHYHVQSFKIIRPSSYQE